MAPFGLFGKKASPAGAGASGGVPGEGSLHARLETSMGDIVVALHEDRAPRTVGNFVGLATGTKEWVDPRTRRPVQGRGLYDSTIFHRVIPDFMVQAGDPLGTGTGGPGYRFEDEFHPQLRHDRPGILSMANSGPHTNGSQFFITEKPTPWLDGRHSVFGEVVQGMDVVRAIARVPRDARDRPRQDVELRRIEVFRKAAEG